MNDSQFKPAAVNGMHSTAAGPKWGRGDNPKIDGILGLSTM